MADRVVLKWFGNSQHEKKKILDSFMHQDLMLLCFFLQVKLIIYILCK